jgi:hypothetical protein
MHSECVHRSSDFGSAGREDMRAAPPKQVLLGMRCQIADGENFQKITGFPKLH